MPQVFKSLGRSDVPATTNTSVYTVPVSTSAVVNVSICNRNTSQVASIRVALSTSGTPNVADYIEYNTSVQATQVLERTGIAMSAGDRIVVYSSAANISAVVWGSEQS